MSHWETRAETAERNLATATARADQSWNGAIETAAVKASMFRHHALWGRLLNHVWSDVTEKFAGDLSRSIATAIRTLTKENDNGR